MQVILEIVDGPETGRKVWLTRGQVVEVGRTAQAELHLDKDPELSSVHFGINYSSKGVRLLDRDSSNGTFVNGNKVKDVGLRNGDKIQAGRSTFEVLISGESDSDEDALDDAGPEDVALVQMDTELKESAASADGADDSGGLNEPPESRYKTASAQEICEPLELSDEATAILKDDQSPKEYLESLIQNSHFADAVPFLANALLKREAVWWALTCVEMLKEDDLAEPLTEALNCARTWILDPSEENRQAAADAGAASEYQGPASWVALAAAWSFGSLSTPDLPVVPPADDLTPKAVAGAVLMAATAGDASLIAGNYTKIFEKGLAIAEGQDSWEG